jgi:hypothetical protein
MKKKYLFLYRSFWILLSVVYLVLFLVNYVEVHYQVNFDIASPVFEPTYHLILRSAGLIQGDRFSRYSASLAPVTYNLPYFILSVAVLSLIIVFILFAVQKIYQVFKKEA